MAAKIILVFMVASSYGHRIHGLWKHPLQDHKILNERSHRSISKDLSLPMEATNNQERSHHKISKELSIPLKAKNNQGRSHRSISNDLSIPMEATSNHGRSHRSISNDLSIPMEATNNHGRSHRSISKKFSIPTEVRNNQDQGFEPSKHPDIFYGKNYPDHSLNSLSLSESRSGNRSISVNKVPINTTISSLINAIVSYYKSANQSGKEALIMAIMNKLYPGFAIDRMGTENNYDITYGVDAAIPEKKDRTGHKYIRTAYRPPSYNKYLNNMYLNMSPSYNNYLYNMYLIKRASYNNYLYNMYPKMRMYG